MRFDVDPVPYHATADRPGWDSLPVDVQADIAAHLGGPPNRIDVARGGFTSGFAARLSTANGNRMFVKAAGPHIPFLAEAYAREAHINPALPAAVPAPQLHFASQIADWVVLGFEAAAGEAPKLPMTSAAVNKMLHAWELAADALQSAPELKALDPPPLSIAPGDRIQQFTQMAAGNLNLQHLPEPMHKHVNELATLEQQVFAATESNGYSHGDLRPDNMIVGEDRAWICDWNWPGRYRPFFDTACFLAVPYLDGHDADRLFFSHPTAIGVAGEQLDSVLAAMTGYYLACAQQPPFPQASLYLRRHQHHNGLATLDWLANRRGW